MTPFPLYIPLCFHNYQESNISSFLKEKTSIRQNLLLRACLSFPIKKIPSGHLCAFFRSFFPFFTRQIACYPPRKN